MIRSAFIIGALAIGLVLFSCASTSELIDKGQYDKAWKSLASSKTDDRGAQLERLGKIYLDEKRYEDARKCFAAARPTAEEGLVVLADYALSKGKMDEALKALVEAKAWDKAAPVAGELAAAMLVKAYKVEDFKAARARLAMGLPEAPALDRAWAELLFRRAAGPAGGSDWYDDQYAIVMQAFDAVKDPDLAKSHWKDIARALMKTMSSEKAHYKLWSAFNKRKDGLWKAICADIVRAALAEGSPSTAIVFARDTGDPALRLEAAVAGAREGGASTSNQLKYDNLEDAKRTLEAIRSKYFGDFGFDSPEADKVLAEIAERQGARKYAVQAYSKLGDAAGLKRVRLAIADASLSWMVNPGSFQYWAAGSVKLYAEALGSEVEAWRQMGEKVAAVGQARNAVEAFRNAKDPERAKSFLPAAAREELVDKKYEEAAALFVEAKLPEEARGAMRAMAADPRVNRDWSESFVEEKAKPLFSKYWESGKAGLLELSRLAGAANKEELAATLAEAAGVKNALRDYNLRDIRKALGDDADEYAFAAAEQISKDGKGAWSIVYDMNIELGRWEKARIAGISAGRKGEIAAALAKAAKAADDAAVRKEILRNLVALASPEARKAIAGFADDSDPGIAALAGYCVGKGPKSPRAAFVRSDSHGRVAMDGIAGTAYMQVTAQFLIAKEKRSARDYDVAATVAEALSVKPTLVELKVVEDGSTTTILDEARISEIKASGDYDLVVFHFPGQWEESKSYSSEPLEMEYFDAYEVWMPSAGTTIRVEGNRIKLKFDSYAKKAVQDAQAEKTARAWLADRKATLAELTSLVRFLRGK